MWYIVVPQRPAFNSTFNHPPDIPHQYVISGKLAKVAPGRGIVYGNYRRKGG